MVRLSSKGGLLLVCLTSLVPLSGCGGGAGGGGGDTSSFTTRYIYDLGVTPIPDDNLLVSGLSPDGQWMAVREDSPTGYMLDGNSSLFPTTTLGDASVIETMAAGGSYVWTQCFTSTHDKFVAILNLATGKVIRVTDAEIPGDTNEASPDGTSALVSIQNVDTASPSHYAILTSDGTLTPLPNTSLVNFVSSARSNSGWSTGYGVVDGTGNRPINISPAGVTTRLQGSNPNSKAINDSGISAGYDYGSDQHQAGAYWDTTGKETLLKKLIPGNDEEVLGITNDGTMVGYSTNHNNTSFTAVLWLPNGSPVNLSKRVTLTGSESVRVGLAIQDNGRILVGGSDASGNPVYRIIVPVQTHN